MLRFELYKDRKKEWRCRILAGNGKILAHTEGYYDKRNCMRAVDLITHSCMEEEFEIIY